MKALRWHSGAEAGAPRLSVDEVAVPQPASDELLVRIAFSALRGRDSRGPADTSAAALTLGQEFSGIVAGYGPGLPESFRERFPVGLAITAEATLWCGACDACRVGKQNFCDQKSVLGASREGAHAEYVALPARACWSLQAVADRFGLDSALRFGSLAGSYAFALRALYTDEAATAHGWLPGERVLILGAGPQGLATLDLALSCGAAEVHVLETDPSRRHAARELGAAFALAPEDALTLTDRYDRVVDAGGAADYQAALPSQLLAPGGRFAKAQGHAPGALERVIRLLASGRLHPEAIIRDTISLEQALQRLLLQKKAEGKILVQYGNA